jgi:hypothetical protein
MEQLDGIPGAACFWAQCIDPAPAVEWETLICTFIKRTIDTTYSVMTCPRKTDPMKALEGEYKRLVRFNEKNLALSNHRDILSAVLISKSKKN